MIHTAITSSVDGSVVIGVDMNVSDANKELAKLKKKISATEKELDTATEKREKANEEGLFKSGVLDEEKSKLQEIKDRLADLRAMSKDKNINIDTRDRYKAMIPDVQQEYADQNVRVSGLQTEWNKIQNAVERYEAKINDSSAKLAQQIDEAGNLQRQIDEAEAAVSDLAVSDQRVVDLNRELLELKQRQKELEGFDVGLGYEEYDQNAARISEITRELKEYQKALSGTEAQEARDKISEPVSRASLAAQKMNAIVSKSRSLLQAAGTAGAKVFHTVGGALKKTSATLAKLGKTAVSAIKNSTSSLSFPILSAENSSGWAIPSRVPWFSRFSIKACPYCGSRWDHISVSIRSS